MTFHQTIMRTTINTMIKNLLRDVRKDPGRGLRKGLDMTAHFLSDKNQIGFFKWLSSILSSPSHPYGQLIRNKLATLSDDAIQTLCVNLVYTTFHTGAEQIQSVYQKTGKSIPWLYRAGTAKEVSQARVNGNKAQGVYTYFFSDGPVLGVSAALAEANPECTFLVQISALSSSGICALCENKNLVAVLDLDTAQNPARLMAELEENQLVYGFTTAAADFAELDTGDLIDAGCCFGLLTVAEAPAPEESKLPILLFSLPRDIEAMQQIILTGE